MKTSLCRIACDPPFSPRPNKCLRVIKSNAARTQVFYLFFVQASKRLHGLAVPHILEVKFRCGNLLGLLMTIRAFTFPGQGSQGVGMGMERCQKKCVCGFSFRQRDRKTRSCQKKCVYGFSLRQRDH